MQNFYKKNSVVNYADVDSNYQIRLDSILSLFQEVATFHSYLLGIDGVTLKNKSNAMWVLSKMKIKFQQLPKYSQEIEVETWPTEVSLLRFLRDFKMSSNGEVLIEGTSEWCTLDCDTKLPRKSSTVCYPHDMKHREDRASCAGFSRMRESVDEGDFAFDYASSFTDIDTNKHTNNLTYTRLVLNCFSPKEYANNDFKEYEIAYLSQTFYGDKISVYKKQTDYGYYIEGKSNDKQVFTAMLKR